jgi:hypothetical protein
MTVGLCADIEAIVLRKTDQEFYQIYWEIQVIKLFRNVCVCVSVSKGTVTSKRVYLRL